MHIQDRRNKFYLRRIEEKKWRRRKTKKYVSGESKYGGPKE